MPVSERQAGSDSLKPGNTQDPFTVLTFYSNAVVGRPETGGGICPVRTKRSSLGILGGTGFQAKVFYRSTGPIIGSRPSPDAGQYT
jgi:hypothetical protein